MATPDLIGLFVRPLNAAGFVYMATGAIATIVYGAPRLTNDINLVIALTAARVETFRQLFADPSFYVPAEEVIAEELRRSRAPHFNVIHGETGLKADLYPAGADELNSWGLEHRRRIDIDGEALWLAPPEYVIIRKLEYWRDGGSEKHLRDIQSILTYTAAEVDRGMIDREAERRDVSDLWRKAGIGG